MYNEGIHRKEGIVMKQELMDAITEKTKELMNSVTCSAEARAAAQTWLDAVGTQRIEEVTQAQIFGEEKAVQVAEHAKEIKQQGALYCDCPACTAAAYILEKKDELLKAVRDK